MDLVGAGALIALVGFAMALFGAGGGMMATPVLIYIVGLSEREAIAHTVGIIAITCLWLVIGHMLRKRLTFADLKKYLWLIPGGLAGTWIGDYCGSLIDQTYLRLIFAILVILISITTAIGPAKSGKARLKPDFISLSVVGLAAGVFTGMVGIAGGVLLVPALILLFGAEQRLAVRIVLVMITINTIGAWGISQTHEEIQWGLFAAFVGSAIIGSLLGNFLSARLPAAKLRAVFATFLAIVGCAVLVQTVIALVRAGGS